MKRGENRSNVFTLPCTRQQASCCILDPLQSGDLTLVSCLNWKKLDLTTWLICLSILKSQSKITPKFFTYGFTSGFNSPRSNCKDSQVPPGVNNMTSVLLLLKLRKFSAIQCLISSRHCNKGANEEVSPLFKGI